MLSNWLWRFQVRTMIPMMIIHCDFNSRTSCPWCCAGKAVGSVTFPINNPPDTALESIRELQMPDIESGGTQILLECSDRYRCIAKDEVGRRFWWGMQRQLRTIFRLHFHFRSSRISSSKQRISSQGMLLDRWLGFIISIFVGYCTRGITLVARR